jgi:hypothetical protein
VNLNHLNDDDYDDGDKRESGETIAKHRTYIHFITERECTAQDSVE